MNKSFTNPWYDAKVWLAYTLFGLFVTVGIAGLAAAATRHLSLQYFTDGGQFGVYTAGMLVGTQFVLNRPNLSRIPLTEWFALATLLLLFGSAAFVILATLSIHDTSINRDIFRWPSVALFCVSVIIAFTAVGYDNKRLQVDPRASDAAALQRLSDDFDKPERGG